jgi:anti-sigma factor RsiW
MMTCIELDGLITPFVDDVCSPRERAAIVTHLQQCDACRSRVEAEAAARNILRAHAAIGRAMDASPWETGNAHSGASRPAPNSCLSPTGKYIEFAIKRCLSSRYSPTAAYK